jgi:hypothetical protein
MLLYSGEAVIKNIMWGFSAADIRQYVKSASATKRIQTDQSRRKCCWRGKSHGCSAIESVGDIFPSRATLLDREQQWRHFYAL